MIKRMWCLSIYLVCAIGTKAQADDPYIYILGVAQDAGYPQAGCYKPHCMPGWQDRNKRITATSIAVIDKASGEKFLFEATPHLPDQLFRLEQEAPSAQHALSGVFLTHAHIGHHAGLMYFGREAMGANAVPVFAMPRMANYLKSNGPWSQLVSLNNISIKQMQANHAVQFANVLVTPILVPHRDEFSETVGYHIKGPNKSALFIPDINKWHVWKKDIAEEVRSVDYALIDATFYAADELPGRDMAEIPHPYVVESMEALKGLSVRERSKVWFIHMNHTNAMLDPDSDASKNVEGEGYNIAREGIRLGL